MPVVGQFYTPQLTVAGADALTVVALRIIDPHDVATVVAVAPATPGVPGVWVAAPVHLNMAGLWRLAWDVVGPGADGGPYGALLGVGPDPAGNIAGFSFATTTDLADHSGAAPPDDARRKLVDASREVERLTKTARYDVDPTTGLARDPDIRKALAAATCELVGWWAETGAEAGAPTIVTSASIAGVSLGFGGKGGGVQTDPVGPRVHTILAGAGLLQPGGVFYG